MGPSGDVLTHAPFLERARAEHLGQRDDSAQMALGAYLVARLVARALASSDDHSTLARQIEAVRRRLRALPSDAPESAHLNGIVDAIPTSRQPRTGLRLGLMAYAYYLEHEGRLEEALEMLGLAVRTHGTAVPIQEFAAAALFSGRLSRLLARWPESTSAYLAAESAAEQAGDRVLVLRARLGRSAVLRGMGNLPESRAMVEAVVAAACSADLPDVQAMALSDLGAVCALEGRQIEAVEANYQAFLLTDDSLTRMRVLGDLGIGLREIGAYEVARLAFEIVAASRTSFLVRTNAVLELLELESTLGNRLGFERRRSEAERLRDRMPPSMQTDFCYKAGVGLARFDQSTRARELLAEGMAIAETNRLNAWYFRLERVLDNLDACAREPEPSRHSGSRDLPAVKTVAVGLRDYAASTR